MDGLIQLLETNEAKVSVLEKDGYISIGLKTEHELEYKWISKELYDLLVKELSGEKGGYQNTRPNSSRIPGEKCKNPLCIKVLQNKYEKYRGTCDSCVEAYKMGWYPCGFPPAERYVEQEGDE